MSFLEVIQPVFVAWLAVYNEVWITFESCSRFLSYRTSPICEMLNKSQHDFVQRNLVNTVRDTSQKRSDTQKTAVHSDSFIKFMHTTVDLMIFESNNNYLSSQTTSSEQFV